MIDSPPATNPEAIEDFGILVTLQIDEWIDASDAGTDLRESPGEVVVDFLRDPVNEQLVAAVLAERGWLPPGHRPCTRSLKRSHGAHCSLTQSE